EPRRLLIHTTKHWRQPMTDEAKMPDDCEKAFEDFLKRKSLSNEKTADAWDRPIYKHSKIDAMYYAWRECWNTRADKATDAGDAEIEALKFWKNYENGDTDNIKALVKHLNNRGYLAQPHPPAVAGDK